MPFFSIIIPLYNKENYIENTLKSVFEQNFTDFEVIIVNDGSTDESEAKVSNFKDARIRYFSKKNEGASTARNLGIEMAKSDYITFLDADDYWFPDFLYEMSLCINQFPNEKIFACAIEIETSNKTFPAQYSIQKIPKRQVVNYFDASRKKNVIWTSSGVFHKSVFEDIGVFDTDIKSGQDTDLWIRMGLAYTVVFSWKILARYVYDPESLSKKKINIQEKLNFSKFATAEKNNLKLKKHLDANRFSLAIKCKLNNDFEGYKKLYQDIDLTNLSIKKRMLLYLPSYFFSILLKLNLLFIRIGLSKSVFK